MIMITCPESTFLPKLFLNGIGLVNTNHMCNVHSAAILITFTIHNICTFISRPTVFSSQIYMSSLFDHLAGKSNLCHWNVEYIAKQTFFNPLYSEEKYTSFNAFHSSSTSHVFGRGGSNCQMVKLANFCHWLSKQTYFNLLYSANKKHFPVLSIHPHPLTFLGVVGQTVLCTHCCWPHNQLLLSGRHTLCTVVHVGPVKASPRADSYPADFNRRSPPTLSFQHPAFEL